MSVNAVAQNIRTKSTYEYIDSLWTKTEMVTFNPYGKIIEELRFGRQNNFLAKADTIFTESPVTGNVSTTITCQVLLDYQKTATQKFHFFDKAGKRTYSVIQEIITNENNIEQIVSDTLYYVYNAQGYTVNSSNINELRNNYSVRIDAQGNEMRLDELSRYTFNKQGKVATQMRKNRVQKFSYNKAGYLIKKVNIDGKKIASTYSYSYNAQGQRTIEYVTYPGQKRELLRKFFFDNGILVKEVYYDDGLEEVKEYKYVF